jgi:hypothetical protein
MDCFFNFAAHSLKFSDARGNAIAGAVGRKGRVHRLNYFDRPVTVIVVGQTRFGQVIGPTSEI